MSQVERQRLNGIETVSYLPEDRIFDTPIIMLHGMWHGAWCWQDWQQRFADCGWESHAISLSGHGKSESLRPIRRSTLTFYLQQLEQEVFRHDRRPIVIAHSMGGAIAQWYLKRHDDLAACVLLAPWPASGIFPATVKAMAADPVGALRSLLHLELGPMVRSPERCEAMFLSKGASISSAQFCEALGSDSFLALAQFCWPMWRAPREVKTPLLWVSAERDGLFDPGRCRNSVTRYGADHIIAEDAAHDVMLEARGPSAATKIHQWLVDRAIA